MVRFLINAAFWISALILIWVFNGAALIWGSALISRNTVLIKREKQGMYWLYFTSLRSDNKLFINVQNTCCLLLHHLSREAKNHIRINQNWKVIKNKIIFEKKMFWSNFFFPVTEVESNFFLPNGQYCTLLDQSDGRYFVR